MNGMRWLAASAPLLLGGCGQSVGDLASDVLCSQSWFNCTVVVQGAAAEEEAISSPQFTPVTDDPCHGKFTYNHVRLKERPIQFDAPDLGSGVNVGTHLSRSCEIFLVQVRPKAGQQMTVTTSASALALTNEGRILAASQGDRKAQMRTTGEWINVEAVVRSPLETVVVDIEVSRDQ